MNASRPAEKPRPDPLARRRSPKLWGYCTRCGHTLLREDVYCPSCGAARDYGEYIG